VELFITVIAEERLDARMDAHVFPQVAEVTELLVAVKTCELLNTGQCFFFSMLVEMPAQVTRLAEMSTTVKTRVWLVFRR